ncbi:MoxR-like ATPase [Palleronia aestuarii]|uniref:MoxR-like ATPase n=1 Tax=Palleronia aestuarii TaxID=568105 RepID=A0A2W7N8G1_9RHOB|nr:MoxR family ATPase [Palleronia aestuarii]PZX14477.1 MoxR-like ATPase [Palleronia aestuarii]
MAVNARAVSAGQALEALAAGWAAQEAGALTASYMLHGRPGVGKTEIVETLARRRGAQLFDLRLTTIEPQDLRGLPFYDHDTKRTVWYPPDDLPHDPGAPAILFLDELTAAAPALQPTVYGLLQERRIGRYRLPDTTLVVGAGNEIEDGAVAYEMGTALADRLVHMVVRADAADWVQGYAPAAGIHPAVVAFIRTRPDLLETTEAELKRGHTVACTPRSWTRVSHILGAVSDRRIRDVLIAGTVGNAAAAEFVLIADEIAASVHVDEMLAASRRERRALYPTSLHGLTALIYGAIAVADERTLPAVIEILADLRELDAAPFRGLPLAELAGFGFEILIRKALENGWEEHFAGSEAYATYAEDRRAAGLS